MSWQRRSSSAYEASPHGRRRGHPDLEKEASRIPAHIDDDDDEEDDTPTSYSSRNTASSQQAMLTNAYSTSSRPFSLLRFPSSIIRWLCLILLSVVILFILTLIRMSWNSNRQVEQMIKAEKPAAPPAQWESFPFLERYYGGVRNLVSRASNTPEYPRDDYDLSGNMTNARRQAITSNPFNPYWATATLEFVECFLDEKQRIRIPATRPYNGIPRGFPNPVMGSNALFGLKQDICYDRFGRLGPYGLGYGLSRGGSGAALEGDREGADMVWKDTPEIDFRGIKWVDAQNRCATQNKNRFPQLPKPRTDRFRFMQVSGDLKGDIGKGRVEDPESAPLESMKLPRTAIVIRTWHDFKYTAEDIIYVRSIIAELAILSGAEYTIHFLIQVKDDNLPIWSDDTTYESVVNDALPEEFRGMGTLWSERQMGLIYGGLTESFIRGLPVHGVYRSTFMPMQYFAYQHPEYDYFWNWEMDIRYTGHWYDLFQSVVRWARDQPRKGLWERGSRFYVPTEHGTWDDFNHTVRVQTTQGTNSPNNIWAVADENKGQNSGSLAADGKQQGQHIGGDKPIWGPERPIDDDIVFASDPSPPTSYEADKHQWGVGEEADLITFNPLFDPAGTTWLLAEDVTGYNTSRAMPPRRTAIITASRLSKRLLNTMHRETALSHHTMFSEMWPASCALHHGLKVVYAPHSEYIDRRWPTKYLESVFNAGRNGATGGSRSSVFGDREHNFRGTTWYYSAGFPEVLWNRWLGHKFNNAGGEEFELNDPGEGRMCLPPMLLHPIKRVDLVVEGLRDG